MLDLQLLPGQKVYFASDFHLGTHTDAHSRHREEQVMAWLDYLRADAQAVFLVGDVFDFWFEYRKVVPKGFVRFLGKVAELRAAGIQFYLFAGNHDLWLADYFPQELGIPVFHAPTQVRITDPEQATPRLLLVGHGDGLGPGDRTYRTLLKPMFSSRFLQWAFRWLHPDVGMALAHRWSRHSRRTQADHPKRFTGEETEWIYQYCRSVEARQHHDFYVFGHRHLPLDLPLGTHSRYLNLGEWLHARTYAVYASGQLSLRWFAPMPGAPGGT